MIRVTRARGIPLKMKPAVTVQNSTGTEERLDLEISNTYIPV